ncbi:MAG: hypothetical protein LC732_02180, partial [Acidobacteria bacterium]|nr:hypothetical protein [Acidobacteriota bacterium]
FTLTQQTGVDPNRAPEITSSDSFEFVERATGPVFTPAATDPDSDPVTFTLSGADAGLFEIDPVSGAVAFADTPLFADGGDNEFSFTLTASDGTLTDEQTVTVELLKDTDIDGVPDKSDNAIEVKNPDQRDTDDDDYGNVIDADFNNDGSINLADLGVFANAFGATGLEDGVDPEADADFNGDGKVDLIDLGRFAVLFDEPLGPSFIDGVA